MNNKGFSADLRCTPIVTLKESYTTGVERTAGHRSCPDEFLLWLVTFTDLIYSSGHFFATNGNIISRIYFSIMIFSTKWKHFSLCWLVCFVVENHEQSITLLRWVSTMKKWSLINMRRIQNKNYVWSVLLWAETGARQTDRQTDRRFPNVFFLFPNNSELI